MTWQRLTLVGAVLAIFILALLIRRLMVKSPEVWLFLVLLTFMLGLFLYWARQQTKSIRLRLEQTGFRYTRHNFDITVAWSDIRTLQRRERNGQVLGLGVITRQGKYLALGGLEKMPEIVAYIESQAKNLDKEPSLASRLKLNASSGYVPLALFVIGVGLKLRYPQSDPVDYLGSFILLCGFISLFWLAPDNTGQRKPLKRFFWILGIWTVLVLTMLIALYFVRTQQH